MICALAEILRPPIRILFVGFIPKGKIYSSFEPDTLNLTKNPGLAGQGVCQGPRGYEEADGGVQGQDQSLNFQIPVFPNSELVEKSVGRNSLSTPKTPTNHAP